MVAIPRLPASTPLVSAAVLSLFRAFPENGACVPIFASNGEITQARLLPENFDRARRFLHRFHNALCEGAPDDGESEIQLSDRRDRNWYLLPRVTTELGVSVFFAERRDTFSPPTADGHFLEYEKRNDGSWSMSIGLVEPFNDIHLSHFTFIPAPGSGKGAYQSIILHMGDIVLTSGMLEEQRMSDVLESLARLRGLSERGADPQIVLTWRRLIQSMTQITAQKYHPVVAPASEILLQRTKEKRSFMITPSQPSSEEPAFSFSYDGSAFLFSQRLPFRRNGNPFVPFFYPIWKGIHDVYYASASIPPLPLFAGQRELSDYPSMTSKAIHVTPAADADKFGFN